MPQEYASLALLEPNEGPLGTPKQVLGAEEPPLDTEEHESTSQGAAEQLLAPPKPPRVCSARQRVGMKRTLTIAEGRALTVEAAARRHGDHAAGGRRGGADQGRHGPRGAPEWAP